MALRTISWIAQIIVIVILGQTLFFKFNDHPETVALFEQLDAGAAVYKSIGAAELVACCLLLIPGLIAYGAALSAALMAGAIFAHLTKLGFAGDAGLLGSMAIGAFALSLFILFVRRAQLPFFPRSKD